MPVPEDVEVTFPNDGGCFGCSPTHPSGLNLRFRRRGVRVLSRYTIADRFHGAPGIAHGGIVATSSARPLYDLKTSRHRPWFAEFDVVLTGDDPRIARGKPAPDIYLLAARELRIDPVRCVAIEDAPAGVEAAHAAGMQVIAVPDPALGRDRVAAADMVLDSLVGLRPADLGVAGVASSSGPGA